MNLDATLHLLSRDGSASPLYIYLHGRGGTGLSMTPVADRFAQAYPGAAHLIPEGFDPCDTAPEGRQLLFAEFVPIAQGTLIRALSKLFADKRSELLLEERYVKKLVELDAFAKSVKARNAFLHALQTRLCTLTGS